MKYYLQAFFLLFSITLVLGQRFDIKIVVDGKQRECIIVKPAMPPPPGGYPVVFMLHGTGQDGEKFYDISGWKELGEKENFITVFPTSLKWCFVQDGLELYQTRWVNGQVTENPCSGSPQNYVDDIRFLKKLATIIIDTLPVNSKKIFASGFSNGSAMIHKIAMDAGDVFAAVAGTSSPLSVADSIIPPVHRIPVWFMVGNKDPNYFRPPITEIPFGGDSVLTYLSASLSRALACQGLTPSFTKNESPITHTYIFNERMPMVNSAPYLFTLIKDMIHLYPNGINYPLSAANLFWEFFKQATVVATDNEIQNHDILTVYPNPSSASVHVSIHSKNSSTLYNFKVINSIGQLVYKEDHKTDPDFILDKKTTGAGLFILQMQFENTLISKIIIFE